MLVDKDSFYALFFRGVGIFLIHTETSRHRRTILFFKRVGLALYIKRHDIRKFSHTIQWMCIGNIHLLVLFLDLRGVGKQCLLPYLYTGDS